VPTTGTGGIQGHAHILAYTTGEEHFTDTNNDGIFDDGDTFTPFLHNGAALDYFFGVGSPPQDDIGNPYTDWNENFSYTSGETFESAITNSVRHAPDGKWYGVSCGGLGSTAANVTAKDEGGTDRTVPCGGTTIIIGKEECIVMGTSTYYVMDPTVTNGSPPVIGNTVAPTTISVGTSATATYYFLDSNGDVPGDGATLKLIATGLQGATVTFADGTSGLTVGDIPDACRIGSQGSIPSLGGSLPFKGYAFTIQLLPISGSLVPVSGSFQITTKTPVTDQSATGITVNVVP
jgi:hypothetical protein